MPDKTPLAADMFRFTQEELIGAAPEVLEVLMQNGSMMTPSSENTMVSESAQPPISGGQGSSSSAPQPATATPSVATEDATVV